MTEENNLFAVNGISSEEVPRVDTACSSSLCKVCEDLSSGNHFGVQTCEACKSFFRRSVRANSQFSCRGDRNCSVTKTTRNRCPYCRLQKCFVVGMKREAVQMERGPKSTPTGIPGTSTTQSQNVWTPPTTFVPIQTHPQMVPLGVTAPPMAYQFVPAGVQPQFMSVPVVQPGVVVNPAPTVYVAHTQQQQQMMPPTGLQPVHHLAPVSPSPEQGRDSGIDSHKDDDSSSSEVFSGDRQYSPSSPSSSQSSSSQSSSTPQELASRSTSVAEPPSPQTLPSKYEHKVLDQIKEEDGDHPPARKESFLSGPDVPLPDLDLDELCKNHRIVHTLPEEKKNTPQAVNITDLIKGGKASLGMFVKWIKGIPLFTNLPVVDRVSCVKACYIEQMILTIVYRSLILQSEGMVMGSGKEFKAEEVEHSLISYSIGRIMSELMGNFKSLDLDYKEFICLRLLFLFNPDATGVEPPVKQHIRRIQDVVLVALEDYCTEQYPTMSLRYSKLLLSMASLRSIGQEMTQEVEIKRALASANFDPSQLFQFLDF